MVLLEGLERTARFVVVFILRTTARDPSTEIERCTPCLMKYGEYCIPCIAKIEACRSAVLCAIWCMKQFLPRDVAIMIGHLAWEQCK